MTHTVRRAKAHPSEPLDRAARRGGRDRPPRRRAGTPPPPGWGIGRDAALARRAARRLRRAGGPRRTRSRPEGLFEGADLHGDGSEGRAGPREVGPHPARAPRDGQVRLWWMLHDPRLGAMARRPVASGAPALGAVVFWEVAVTASVGELDADPDASMALAGRQWVARLGATETGAGARAAAAASPRRPWHRPTPRGRRSRPPMRGWRTTT